MLHTRWLIRKDMDEVLQIENQSFDYPWCEDDFLRCLRQRNCIGKIVEDLRTDRVVGFTIYELFDDHFQILNFAVHPRERRRGAGKVLVGLLKGKLSEYRRPVIALTIRETNLAGQQFFRRHGFRATRILHGYYPDLGEDGYLMRYDLAGAVPVVTTGGVNRIAALDLES